jgi:hypothetical protein
MYVSQRRNRTGAVGVLCVTSGLGCWVEGRRDDYCAFIDPRGDGTATVRYCSEQQFALCYGGAP